MIKISYFGLLLFFACSTSIKRPSPGLPAPYLMQQPDFIAKTNEEIFVSDYLKMKDELGHKSTGLKGCDSLHGLLQRDGFPLPIILQIQNLRCLSSLSDFTTAIATIEKHYLFPKLDFPIAQNIFQNSLAQELPPEIKIKYLLVLAENENKAENKNQFYKTIIANISACKDDQLTTRAQQSIQDHAPYLLTEFPEELRTQIAKGLISTRQYQKAREILEPLIEKEKKEKNFETLSNLYFLTAKTYKLQKQRNEYFLSLHLFRRFILKELTTDNFKYYEEVNLEIARAYWTDEENDKAITYLKRLLAKAKSLKLKSYRAAYYLSLISFNEKKEKSAIKYLQQAIDGNVDDLATATDATWVLSLHYFKQQNYKKSVEILSNGIDKNPADYIRFRFLFWQAMGLKQINPTMSQDIFEKLSQEDKLGYYGLLAQIMRGQNILHLNSDTIDCRDIPAEVAWMRAMGEDLWARYFTKKQFSSKNTSRQKLPFIYHLAGWHLRAFQSLLKLPGKIQDKLLDQFPQLFFPLSFKDRYENEAKNFQLPVEILLGISKQESGFDWFARSYADALGLMQVLPDSAKLIPKYNVYNFDEDPELLFSPDINIHAGAYLFNKYLAQFDHNYIFAIMGYNAGPRVVEKWINRDFLPNCPIETCHKDQKIFHLLQFIETIPYSETRDYVKLVLRNFINYKRIYAPPEEILGKEILSQIFNLN